MLNNNLKKIMSLIFVVSMLFAAGTLVLAHAQASPDPKPTATPTATPYTPPANYIAQWGSVGSGNGQLNEPQGIAIAPNGNVYVVDALNYRVEEFEPNGNYITQWGTQGTSGNGEFDQPWGIAVSPITGNVYVTEIAQGTNLVQEFTSSGSFITQWGQGSGSAALDLPYGIAIDSSGNVYVADMGNSRVAVFTSSGTYITQFGTAGTQPGDQQDPTGIAISPFNGNVYVADQGINDITEYTTSGTLVTTWGSFGHGNSQFDAPLGLAIDSSGDVYVADWGNDRVQVFSSSGTYSGQWGSDGSGNGQFVNPTGVAVSPSNGNIYVTDTGNDRVQEFGTPSFVSPEYVYGALIALASCFAAVAVLTVVRKRRHK
jgi:DNA-binding beta-propeller fold protein YncE